MTWPKRTFLSALSLPILEIHVCITVVYVANNEDVLGFGVKLHSVAEKILPCPSLVPTWSGICVRRPLSAMLAIQTFVGSHLSNTCSLMGSAKSSPVTTFRNRLRGPYPSLPWNYSLSHSHQTGRLTRLKIHTLVW